MTATQYLSTDVATIERCISTWVGRVIVLSSAQIGQDLVDRILALSNVAGVILSVKDSPTDPAKDRRVGYRSGPFNNDWTFPDPIAPTLLVLGFDHEIGFRAIRFCHQHGIRTFVFVHVGSGYSKSVSFYHLAARMAVERVVRKLQALTVAAGTRFFNFLVKTLPGWMFNTDMEGFYERQSKNIADWWKSLPEVWEEWWERFQKTPLGRWYVLRYNQWLDYRLMRGTLIDASRGLVSQSWEMDRVLMAIGTLGAGGSERQLVNTALAVAKTGRYRPVVVCTNLRGPGANFHRAALENSGLEVIDISDPAFEIEASQRLLALRDRLFMLRELHHDIGEDVVRFLDVILRYRPAIVHSFLDEINVKLGLAAVLAESPRIILSARSVSPKHFGFYNHIMLPAYRAILKQSSVTLCNNSRAGIFDYLRWLKRGFLQTRLVRNGIDFGEFSVRKEVDGAARAKFGIPADVPVIGSVMRLSEEKQPLLWARAVVEMSRQRPDIHFVLAGDGPMRDDVAVLLSNCRVESRVHRLGLVRDIPLLLRALDVCLLTSRIEGLPNVLIEAQAVGVPVVTTPAGGAGETLLQGRTGFVTADHSPRGVAQACLRLIEDPVLRANLGEAAPEFVRKRFSLDQMIKATLKLYADVR